VELKDLSDYIGYQLDMQVLAGEGGGEDRGDWADAIVWNIIASGDRDDFDEIRAMTIEHGRPGLAPELDASAERARTLLMRRGTQALLQRLRRFDPAVPHYAISL